MSSFTILSTDTLDLTCLDYALFMELSSNDKHHAILPDRMDKDKVIEVLNSMKQPTLWIDFSEICLSEHKGSEQLNLLNTPNEPLLIVRKKSADLSSYYLFKFKPHKNPEDIYYGKDQKYLIATIARLWVANNVNIKNAAAPDYEKYFFICKNQLVRLNYLNNELSSTFVLLKNIFQNVFALFLEGTIPVNKTFLLSDSSINYLMDLNIPYSELKERAIQVYKIAEALNPEATHVVIERYYFIEGQEPKKSVVPEKKMEAFQPHNPKLLQNVSPTTQPDLVLSQPDDSKLSKTMVLLDRYETAVQTLLKDKIPVLGKNIASACTPPISAPALTDSINKHRERIRACFAKHPERWQALQNNYSPIKNINN